MENKKNLIYIIISVIILGVIVYLALTGNFNSSVKQPEKVNEDLKNIMSDRGEVINEEGQVVAPSGQPAKNDAPPGSPEAPLQSPPITEDKVPEDSVKLIVKDNKFNPEVFRVKPNQVVKLSLTSSDGQTHVFMFDNPKLSGVAIGVGPGETRMIVFNAPNEKGEYTFRCDVPGHKDRGEVGKMIVE